ncbi:MAG: SRPBCC family protein [Anaerolineales bacterium]|nr:SRPBCC family protein [Anaerolineales bacterium]
MAGRAEILINAPKEKVWKIITDIENSADNISGIEKIEVLEKPDHGFVGFKWEETRKMFGQSATEIMLITDAVENKYYKTRAEHPNVVYISTLSLEEKNGSTLLSMGFEAEALNLWTKIMSAVMGIFINKSMKKTLHQDLEDIKTTLEG